MCLPSSIFLYINNLWAHYTSLNNFFIISVINKVFITIFVPLLQTYFYIYFFYILFFCFFLFFWKMLWLLFQLFSIFSIFNIYFCYYITVWWIITISYIFFLTFRCFVRNTFFIHFYDKKKTLFFLCLAMIHFSPSLYIWPHFY